MENQVVVFSVLSLKELSLRRVVVNVWSEPDILDSIEKFFTLFPHIYYECGLIKTVESREKTLDYLKKWQENVETEVTDRMSKLKICKSLINEMLLIVAPIGLQINMWKGFHENYLKSLHWRIKRNLSPCMEFDRIVLSKLHWTSEGQIDYCKTARNLIRCESVDILRQYILACLYCLEDVLPNIWQKLPKEFKRTYKNGDIGEIKLAQIEFYWPYVIKGKLSELFRTFKEIRRGRGSFYKQAFSSSINHGNKAAAKYFFQKLTHIEKDSSYLKHTAKWALLMRQLPSSPKSFPSEKISDTFFFLLSVMNHEEQLDLLKESPGPVLKCFMDWPWKYTVSKIANDIWPLISESHYRDLLLEPHSNKLQYYFPKFFQEVFIHCPLNIRKQIAGRESRSCDYFHRFFYYQDSETIRVFFRNIDTEDRMNLVSSEKIFTLFCNYILKAKLDMVRVCLQEAMLSKKSMEEVKNAFLRFLANRDRIQIQESELVHNKFLQLLEEIYMSGGRNSENKSLNKAKKLCSNN